MSNIDNLQSGPRVSEMETLKAGGCNTCTRETHFVYVIQGQGRVHEFRMCRDCMRQLTEGVRKLQGYMPR